MAWLKFNQVHAAGKHIFRRTREYAGRFDKGINAAFRAYNTIAPIIAPLARQALGDTKAFEAHKTVGALNIAYGMARNRVIQADHMRDVIHGALKKEIPSIY